MGIPGYGDIIFNLMRAALIASVGLFGVSAQAGSLTFSVKSSHPNSVQIEFYSQDRDIAWPGSGKAFVINDWDTHGYPLDCQSGETICFGAWVDGNSSTYWGTGLRV